MKKSNQFVYMRLFLACIFFCLFDSACVSPAKKMTAKRDKLRFANVFEENRDSVICDLISKDREKRILMYADWKNSLVRMHDKFPQWTFLDSIVDQLDSARVLSIMEADTLGTGSKGYYKQLSIVPMTEEEFLLRYGKMEDAAAYTIPHTRMIVLRYSCLRSYNRFSWWNAKIFLHELCHDYLYRKGYREHWRWHKIKYKDPFHDEHVWIANIERHADTLLKEMGMRENPKWTQWNWETAFNDPKDENPYDHFAIDLREYVISKQKELRFRNLPTGKYDSIRTADLNNRVALFDHWKSSVLYMHEVLPDWPLLDTLVQRLAVSRVLSIMEADTMGISYYGARGSQLLIIPRTRKEAFITSDPHCYFPYHYGKTIRRLILYTDDDELGAKAKYNLSNAENLLQALYEDYLFEKGDTTTKPGSIKAEAEKRLSKAYKLETNFHWDLEYLFSQNPDYLAFFSFQTQYDSLVDLRNALYAQEGNSAINRKKDLQIVAQIQFAEKERNAAFRRFFGVDLE